MMKRIGLLFSFCLIVLGGMAQVEEKYGIGSVPVVNGRVMFQDTVSTKFSGKEAYAKVLEWAKVRFGKPNVIISKFVQEDDVNYQIGVTAEERMVFKNKFFVYDYTRINYWVDLQCKDDQCIIRLTRIKYWYEEERDGGSKFSAEEWITDENAFNAKQTKLLKEPGKFRKKTIDFFDQLVSELSQLLQ